MKRVFTLISVRDEAVAAARIAKLQELEAGIPIPRRSSALTPKQLFGLRHTLGDGNAERTARFALLAGNA